MIDSIVTAVLSSAAVSGILIWLTKSWISERLRNAIRYEYDQKLETYKSQLRYEADSELEKIRAELQIDAAKRHVQFSRTFDEIATTVAEVYSRLVVFKDSVASYVSMIEMVGEPSKEEKRKATAERMKEFVDYYKSRKIYLPENTTEQIDKFWQGLYEISVDFMYGVEHGRDLRSKGDKDTWSEAHNYTTKEVPTILKTLETEFRNLLGVDLLYGNTEQTNAADRERGG